MTKQEEIMKGLIRIVPPPRAKEILSYLHSRGVVIKVEGELPQIIDEAVATLIEPGCPLDEINPRSISEAKILVYEGRDIMLKAGYAAVESLIES